MKAVYYTNKGKVRDKNQDCILARDVVQEDMQDFNISNNIKNIAAVADGVGGAPYGELASKYVLEYLKENEKLPVVDIIKGARDKLKEIEKKHPEKRGMATTLSGISLKESIVFNSGDSRVYKKKGGNLWQLTYDQVNENTNTLTSAITSSLNIDEVQTKKVKINEGDIFFLCTDGLWKEFDIEELEECFLTGNIETAANEIIQKLKVKKQKDNVSFIILKI